MNTISFQEAITGLEEMTYQLKVRLEQYSHAKFPSTSMANFVNELSSICNSFYEKVCGLDVNEVSYQQLRIYNLIFSSLQTRAVAYISQSTISMHPVELMLPVKEIIGKYEESEILFFTQPTWDINYSISEFWSGLAQNLNKELDLEISDYSKKIMINFPTTLKNDVLLGCIMGHELGHYFDLHTDLKFSEQILAHILSEIDYSVLSKFMNITRADGRKLEGTYVDKELYFKQILTFDDSFLKSWIHEFVADIVGIILYGPASHFASEHLFTFLYTNSIQDNGRIFDAFSVTHPRTQVRSKVKNFTLDKIGFEKNFDECLKKEIEKSKNRWSDCDTQEFTDSKVFLAGELIITLEINNDYLNELESILLSYLPYMYSLISQQMPEQVQYKLEQFETEVKKLTALILNLIPPNLSHLVPENTDDFKPSNSISILNAGWYVYLCYKDLFKSGFSDALTEQDIKVVLNNLISKALSSSDIHRRWTQIVDIN